jgi:hypothetical protein
LDLRLCRYFCLLSRWLPDMQPPGFSEAMAELRAIAPRREIELSESPAPQRLAPFAVALSAEVVIDDLDMASGRLVLLHDPDGQEAWEGYWRVVIFAKATLEPEMATDPMLSDVGWTWLEESLVAEDIALTAFGGTATRTHSVAYGAIGDREAQGQLEIRASWTPLDSHAGPHANAWLALLTTMAGLTPVPAGVTSIVK